MRSNVAATLFFGILGVLSAAPPIPIKVVIVTMFEAGADTGDPVSYTHLDVYKRQVNA